MHKQMHMTLMTISESVFRSTSMLESLSKAPWVQLYAVPCWHYPPYFAFLLDLSARLGWFLPLQSSPLLRTETVCGSRKQK